MPANKYIVVWNNTESLEIPNEVMLNNKLSELRNLNNTDTISVYELKSSQKRTVTFVDQPLSPSINTTA
jgi:hypothetical protein